MMQINGIIRERKRRTNNTIVEENIEESANLIKQKNKTKKNEVIRNDKKCLTLNIANNPNLSNPSPSPIKNILITNAESIINNDYASKNANKLIKKKTDSSKDFEKGASTYLKEFKEKTSIISAVNIKFKKKIQ